MFRLIVLIAVLVSISPALYAQPVLKGHITHKATLSPVGASLQPGKKFSKNVLLNDSSVNRWFKIPDWLAGTWLESTQTRVFRHDLVSGAKDRRMKTFIAKGEEPWGEQMDADGGIWQYVRLGQTTVLEGKERVNYGHIRLVEPLSVNKKEVTVRVELLNLAVEKGSGKIVGVSQQEQIMTYKPRGAGVIKVVGSIRTYDRNGKPLQTAHTVYVAQRIKDFSPLDRIAEIDLSERFHEYLGANGLSELIP